MDKNTRIVKKIDNPKVSLTLMDNGIAYVFFKPNLVMDVEFQIQLLDHYNELTGGQLIPFLFEAGEGVTLTKEGRDKSIENESLTPLKATAVVVNNLAHRIIANFYLKFHKPLRPYKVFSKKEEALSWLLKHL